MLLAHTSGLPVAPSIPETTKLPNLRRSIVGSLDALSP